MDCQIRQVLSSEWLGSFDSHLRPVWMTACAVLGARARSPRTLLNCARGRVRSSFTLPSTGRGLDAPERSKSVRSNDDVGAWAARCVHPPVVGIAVRWVSAQLVVVNRLREREKDHGTQ